MPPAIDHLVHPTVVFFAERPQARTLGFALHALRAPDDIAGLAKMLGCVVKIDDRNLLDLRQVGLTESQSERVEQAPMFLGTIGQLHHLEIGA